MASVFSRIIAREIPAYIVAEDANYIAFLDANPVQVGHTLVVPKAEIDDIFDQSDEVLAGLLLFAKPVATRIKAAIPCKRIGLSVVGLEVPHTHLHLIPINTVQDMHFGKSVSLSATELTKIAEQIRVS